MIHASLCKRTYKNGMWFQGSGAWRQASARTSPRTYVTRTLGPLCVLALLLSIVASSPLQAANITVTPTTVPDGLVGLNYMTVQLNASGGVAPYNWFTGSFSSPSTSVPPGMQFNSNGTITGTPTTAGTYAFPVDVDDQHDDFGSATINITILPMSITTTSLPAATVGEQYSAQLQVNGGVGAITWSIQCVNCSSRMGSFGSPPGSAQRSRSALEPPHGLVLPTGLSLNPSSGLISGVPTESGLYQFTVVAEDQASNIASQTLSINVSACVPTLAPASPLPPGDVSIPYSAVTFAVSGCPDSTFTFSEQPIDPFNPNTLPPGLFISNSGVLKGTPTGAGAFSFFITLTDQNQQQAQFQYSVTINPLPTITTTSPLPNGPVGVLYSQQISASSGTPPYVFDMNNNPPGITISQSGVLSGTPTKAGTFSFNIGVNDSLGAQTVAPFKVTFATPISELQVSPLSLTFNVSPNGNPPPTQAISVVPANGATPPVNFQVAINGGQSNTPAPSWITVTPTSGAAPVGLVVSVNQGTLAAGNYTAGIQVVDSNGFATDVAVALNVTSPPQQLTVTPTLLSFAARSATPGNLMEQLVVSNSGAGSLAFTTSVVNKSPWISNVTASSSSAAQNAPVFAQVQVNTNGLAAGAYQDTILVSSSAGNIQIPVSLFVAPSGPILALDTTGVLFQAIEGGGSTATQIVQVLNLGDPASTVNWSATLVSGSNWLSLASASGAATGSTPGVLTLALAPNATQLAAGPYYAIVKIADSNSLNSPQYVTAVLNLQPSSAVPAPDLAPVGLFFTTPVGGSAPSAQQVQINTSSPSPATFDATASTSDNGTWLSVSPASGSTSGQASGSIAVTVNPMGLAAGIYSGDVNVSIGALLESVNVTFVVQPTGTSNAIARFKPEAASCTPSKLAITETGLGNNFAVPAGWPATLIVQLNNDCAAPVTNGNVVASFSNGDASLNLAGDSLGNYSATWQPGAVNANLVITLNATAGSLQPATAALYGGIAQNQTPPPTIVSGGALNNLNPVVGAPLSPGTITAIYGTGLAPAAVTTGAAPLPIAFNNTFALVGPTQAPLYSLGQNQIDLQIPYEAIGADPQQVPVILSVNNALTLPLMVNMVAATPGVLSAYNGPSLTVPQNGAQIVAQHSADGSLVSSASPAKPGEYLVMYLVGMGATNPSVASGASSPGPPGLASVVNQPTVTVGSEASSVYFAGLTPAFVGLYQIDFQVPPGAPSGNLVVTVTQNGFAANPTMLPVSN